MARPAGVARPGVGGVALGVLLLGLPSDGGVYATKLLRRGIEIERPRPDAMLDTLSVADVI